MSYFIVSVQKKKKVGELKSQFGFHLNEKSQLISPLSGYVYKNKLAFIFIYLFLNETGSPHCDWGTLLISNLRALSVRTERVGGCETRIPNASWPCMELIILRHFA